MSTKTQTGQDRNPRCNICGSRMYVEFSMKSENRKAHTYECMRCDLGKVTRVNILSKGMTRKERKRLQMYRDPNSFQTWSVLAYLDESMPLGEYVARKMNEEEIRVELPENISLPQVEDFGETISSPERKVERDRDQLHIHRSTSSESKNGNNVVMADGNGDPNEKLHPLKESVDENIPKRRKRALTEEMKVRLKEQGIYYVETETTATQDRQPYEVNIMGEGCNCPDSEKRDPEDGCKHEQRVEEELERANIPYPDGSIPEVVADGGHQIADLKSRIQGEIKEKEDKIRELEAEINSLEHSIKVIEKFDDDEAEEPDFTPEALEGAVQKTSA